MQRFCHSVQRAAIGADAPRRIEDHVPQRLDQRLLFTPSARARPRRGRSRRRSEHAGREARGAACPSAKSPRPRSGRGGRRTCWHRRRERSSRTPPSTVAPSAARRPGVRTSWTARAKMNWFALTLAQIPFRPQCPCTATPAFTANSTCLEVVAEGSSAFACGAARWKTSKARKLLKGTVWR